MSRTGECNQDDATAILEASPSTLFPGARAPEAALSGLLLLAGCWDKSHEVSQDIASSDGSYWHAIAHRIEPDSPNAAYWFRRVGTHPIFPELQRRASGILERSAPWTPQASWDPFLFIDWCDEARRAQGSDKEDAALRIQRAEWDLLFAWCADS